MRAVTRLFSRKKQASEGCGVLLPYSNPKKAENASKTASKGLLAVGGGVSKEKLLGLEEGLYILDGRKPVLCEDGAYWHNWMIEHKRAIAKTKVFQFTVSTIFLGIDHGFGCGWPVLFETVVFADSLEEMVINRYATWEEAELGHYRVVDEAVRTVQELKAGVKYGIWA